MTADEEPAPPEPTATPRWRRAARAAVPVLLVVGLLVWLVADAAREPGRLRLTEAEDVVVELPERGTVEGYVGLALPEGAVVTTGPAGRASTGDVTLGPEESGVVRDGTLMPAPEGRGPTSPALGRVRPRTSANLRERQLTWGSRVRRPLTTPE